MPMLSDKERVPEKPVTLHAAPRLEQVMVEGFHARAAAQEHGPWLPPLDAAGKDKACLMRCPTCDMFETMVVYRYTLSKRSSPSPYTPIKLATNPTPVINGRKMT